MTSQSLAAGTQVCGPYPHAGSFAAPHLPETREYLNCKPGEILRRWPARRAGQTGV